MEVDALTIVGLIGITIVITTGKVFDGARKWLLGFEVQYNPLRVLGEIMSCTMCAGWWVGCIWGWSSGISIVGMVVAGGLIGILSFATDELLSILVASSTRLARNLVPMPQQRMVPVPRRQIAPEDPSISEDDAHAILDRDDEE
jgi:hypothetical protein